MRPRLSDASDRPSNGARMTRSEIILALLAASEGRPYTPVQIQKAAFLIDRNLPEIITDGDGFHFVPYDYGPFDSSVYSDAAILKGQGYATIAPAGSGRWNCYAATDEGRRIGQETLARMPEDSRRYVAEVSNWVRALSFSSLVKSIYDAYPEMRANSIFRG